MTQSLPVFWSVFCSTLSCLCTFQVANAELRPDKVHVADSKKTLSYVHDGLIVGGDKAIDDVIVKDIRRAPNAGYERVVIDLEGTKNGETAGIQRPPYYQIAVTLDEKRLVFTLWGKPKLNFDSRKVIAAFHKSEVVKSVTLLPRVEDETWSFVFELKGDNPIEVFELSNPVRVIMDIKGASAHPVVTVHSRGKSALHGNLPHASAHKVAPLGASEEIE